MHSKKEVPDLTLQMTSNGPERTASTASTASQHIDQLIQERDRVYDPLTDQELHAITEYEKACKEKEEMIHKKNELYFKNSGSSYWALSNKMNTESI
jgi:hypothetical protein